MPHVTVKLYPGRSEEDKARLSKAIVENVMTILKSSEASVSVAIEDVSPDDWTEQVYKPEITGARGTLFKKPGYGPAA